MPPMSTAWPWSSPACAISGIDEMKWASKKSSISSFSSSLPALLALLFFCASLPAAADVIEAGRDVQSAIDSAQPGDIVLVKAGEVNSFVVDRPLIIEGQDSPTVSAAMQKTGYQGAERYSDHLRLFHPGGGKRCHCQIQLLYAKSCRCRQCRLG